MEPLKIQVGLEGDWKHRDWWKRHLLRGRPARDYLRRAGGTFRLEVVIRTEPEPTFTPGADPLWIDWSETTSGNPEATVLESVSPPPPQKTRPVNDLEILLKIHPDPRTELMGYINHYNLIESTYRSDEFYIFSCECGSPDCAGITDPVSVVHEGGLVVWLLLGNRPRRIVVFERDQYRAEIFGKMRQALEAYRGMEPGAGFNGRPGTAGSEDHLVRAMSKTE